MMQCLNYLKILISERMKIFALLALPLQKLFFFNLLSRKCQCPVLAGGLLLGQDCFFSVSFIWTLARKVRCNHGR